MRLIFQGALGVKLLDALFGRSKPKQANLDALFALPSVAITLQAGARLRPLGRPRSASRGVPDS